MIDTGAEDPLIGRDRLEIRKIVPNSSGFDREIYGPYFGIDKGESSIFYTPGYDQEFSINSNPNSNFIVNSPAESYAQSITSGFSVENIRIEGSTVKADVKVDNYEIDENTTLAQGKWYINNDLTITSGVTLTIQEGTELVFNTNTKLVVDGNLICQGTLSNPITFTSSDPTPQYNDWTGIEVNGGGSSATIDHCVIEYANSGIKFNSGAAGTVSNSTIKDNYYGVYTNNSEPVINNCTINNNKYGLRLYNSYDTPTWSTAHISNCSISNNSYYGIYLYKSSPTLSDNSVHNNGRGAAFWYNDSDPIIEETSFTGSTYYGVACYGGPSPNFNYNSGYNFGGYNTITDNNSKGVRITGSSYPNFGETQTSLGGYNSIYGNTGYEMENTTSNTINAQHNWWGNVNGPQSGDLSGSFLTFRYLGYDPNGGSSQSSSANPKYSYKDPKGRSSFQVSTTMGPPVYVYDEHSDLPEDLQIASFKQNIAEYETSADMFKQHFENDNKSKHGVYASVQYLKSLKYYKQPKSIIDEIELNLKKKQAVDVEYELLSGEASNLVLEKRSKEAIEKLDEALKLKLSKYQNNQLLANKAMIFTYELDDAEQGKELFEEIIKKDKKDSPWYELAENELGLLNEKSSLPKDNVESNFEVMPDKYELVGNYPNPFNPSTKIKYTLPFSSEVGIVIYDVMGRVVKSFTLNSQSAGSHEVEWNSANNYGQKVSSGIYLLRFEANSLENNKQFAKTSKLMLVK